MTIEVGDTIPDIQIMTTIGGKATHVQSREVLGSGKVVLFGVPGAFTPTCSDYHLPSYVIRRQELAAKGVATVACISVNDPFVMDAWGDSQNVGDSVLMLADGNGEFTAAVGLEMDGRGFGLGSRSQRYAMVLEDGVVSVLQVEPGGGLTVSAADAILEAL